LDEGTARVIPKWFIVQFAAGKQRSPATTSVVPGFELPLLGSNQDSSDGQPLDLENASAVKLIAGPADANGCL
jgi:hypothetical protein